MANYQQTLLFTLAVVLFVHPVSAGRRRSSCDVSTEKQNSPNYKPCADRDRQCPEHCPHKCCDGSGCGSEDECESQSAWGAIIFILFCCCIYGGIGACVYLCIRTQSQPHPGLQNAGQVTMVMGPQPGPHYPTSPMSPYGHTMAAGGGPAYGQTWGAAPPLYTASVVAPGGPPQQAGVGNGEWQQATAPDGHIYEYNLATGESRWPAPGDPVHAVSAQSPANVQTAVPCNPSQSKP